jgi:hypothetical protein
MNAIQLWIKQFCLKAKNKSLRGQKDGFFLFYQLQKIREIFSKNGVFSNSQKNQTN